MNKRKLLFIFIIFFMILGISTKVNADDEEEFTEYYGILDTSLKSMVTSNSIQTGIDDLGADPTVQSIKKYYYNQLTSKIGREVYNALLADPNGTKSQITINFSSPPTASVKSVTNDNIKNVYKTKALPYVRDGLVMFISDNPMIYWWYGPSLSYKYVVNGKNVTIKSITLYSNINERNKNTNFKNKITSISNSISGSSVYETVKKIHDYVCSTITYTKVEDTNIDQTAYGAAINKKCVCEGYAKLFKALCDKKGIVCITVSGMAYQKDHSGPHQWCYVYHPLEKKWYGVDPTWDDLKKYGKGTVYNYFLIGSETQVKTDAKFKDDHKPGRVLYKDQTFIPKFPTLSTTKYERFKITISRSTKQPTNKNVKITLKSNRPLKPLNGWTLASDKLSLTKIYASNKTETLTVKNERGEYVKFELKVENIDKVAPVVTTKYSEKNLTNKNVTVTLTGNEQLKPITGWTLSQDKKTLTKIYQKNASETVTVSDLAGNTVDKKIEITNIDKELSTFKISYDKIQPTNESVTVTITATKELKPVDGWDQSEDKKKLTKKYDENTSEKVKVETINGYTRELTINIKNIDKVAPEAEVKYSTVEKTNNMVNVQIIANEQLKPILGWNLSQDNKTLSKNYLENTKENVTISDLAGNTKEVTIEIANIENNQALFNVSYSSSRPTNQDVIAKIESTEELKQIDSWTLSEDKKSLTKTYSENTSEIVNVETEKGNKGSVEIIINQIDKTPPKVEVKYSTTETTTGKVKVQLVANEELQELYGWTLSEDKKILSKDYSKNVEDTITVTDLAGNSVEVKISIQNIQKVNTECEVSYKKQKNEKGEEYVVVIIKSTKEMKEKEGWTLSKDKKTMAKTYYDNTAEDLIIELENGQEVNVVVEVDQIVDSSLDDDGKDHEEEYQEDEEKDLTIEYNIDDDNDDYDGVDDEIDGTEEKEDEDDDDTSDNNNNNNSNNTNKGDDKKDNSNQNEDTKKEDSTKNDSQKEETNNSSNYTNKNQKTNNSNSSNVAQSTKKLRAKENNVESQNSYKGNIIPKLGKFRKVSTIILIITLIIIAIIYFIKYKSYNDVK